MIGTTVDTTTGKVLYIGAQNSKPSHTGHIFLENITAPTDTKLDIAAYPRVVSWIESPESKERKVKIKRSRDKRKGFSYQGKFLSATSQDQNGLVAVMVGFQNDLITGNIKFKFSNGEIMTFNKTNVMEFAGKWSTFRQSFFQG